jgi:GxxExxY protein
MQLRGLAFHVEWPLPVQYKGLRLDCGYRVDILVEDRLIVELKVVEQVLLVHQAQILSYMKLAGVRTSLLINFNVSALKDGLQRFVL